jgi:hypothetical protein
MYCVTLNAAMIFKTRGILMAKQNKNTVSKYERGRAATGKKYGEDFLKESDRRVEEREQAEKELRTTMTKEGYDRYKKNERLRLKRKELGELTIDKLTAMEESYKIKVNKGKNSYSSHSDEERRAYEDAKDWLEAIREEIIGRGSAEVSKINRREDGPVGKGQKEVMEIEELKRELQKQEEENRELNREIQNAHHLIKKQKMRISLPDTSPEQFREIAENYRKKNGSLNYSAIGRHFKVTNHTAKRYCNEFGIKD